MVGYICSVGIKFKGYLDITLEEFQQRAKQVDDLANRCGRVAKIRCDNGSLADIYYDFDDEKKAIGFLVTASRTPGIIHAVYDNQRLF